MRKFVQPMLLLFGILPLVFGMIVSSLSMYIVVGLNDIIERLVNVGD